LAPTTIFNVLGRSLLHHNEVVVVIWSQFHKLRVVIRVRITIQDLFASSTQTGTINNLGNFHTILYHITIWFPLLLEASSLRNTLTSRPAVYHQHTIHQNSSPHSRISTSMAASMQEMSYTLVFGIAGIMVDFAALLVAYLQLRKSRRVHSVYELAWD
jgi:hypothetical protein